MNASTPYARLVDPKRMNHFRMAVLELEFVRAMRSDDIGCLRRVKRWIRDFRMDLLRQKAAGIEAEMKRFASNLIRLSDDLLQCSLDLMGLEAITAYETGGLP